MIHRWICCLTLGLALSSPAAAAEPLRFGSPSAVLKASELKGRIVETRDGEELGRVQDFAIDLESGRIGYVVVSVGSFLIEDSLIAVAPDALRKSADADGRLVLEASAADLRAAQRFSQSGSWPLQADVLAAAGDAPPDAPPAAEGEPTPRVERGTAMISDGQRTATLSAGERSIRFEPAGVPPGAAAGGGDDAAAPPATRFERLDRNRDGSLDRAEIAHELTRNDSYSAIDRDGSGGIDPDEYQALLDRRSEPESSEGDASTR
ncbi:MAG TPA: PRC-barrel domain-containing protein [Pseudomonadales bacterium]